MQWLIDIIMKLVDDRIKAWTIYIFGSLGFFNRGDPATQDFVKGHFTTDWAWHELDLSSVVPLTAKAVLLRSRLNAPATQKAIQFRTNGNTEAWNLACAATSVANLFTWNDLIVAPDAHGKVEYRISNVAWANIDITIAGWWLR